MTAVETLMNMMKNFLDGNYPIEDFSFDFPDELISLAPELEKNYPELDKLFNKDIPEICSGYEPDEEQRKQYPDLYFSEQQIREKILEVYTQAQRLI